jgi:tRNA pseudouridine38-40 synthase
MRVVFRLGWWGAGFAGSQRQPGARTVEGELIAACLRTKVFEDADAAGFSLSGRTDRGVHARGQVGALTTAHPERVGTVLNRALPDDIWVTEVGPAPDGWHPRYDVRSRTYRYFFPDPDLDRVAMDRAAARFVGEHDFTRLCRSGGKHPIRRVLASSVLEGETGPVFEVTAWSYLWHQVRCMASVLEAIGRGERDGDEVVALLDGSARRNPPPAPADALVLWNVDAGIDLSPLPPGDEGFGAFLDATANRHRAQAGIAQVLKKG